ncbi:hypothetical protein CSV71_14240 [Sporosarcina sp. P21c]|uniref:hypothetical protein n=1 Tax=Sporosarcina sp. P21c TaxID=2048255 RepID=UPI000C16AB77|nr:hypothetical protein [Sporosarcina sp. P21c]PIC88545.1 hypothetical protein CSV71_14240 [Sporosarcina sp. P21c]
MDKGHLEGILKEWNILKEALTNGDSDGLTLEEVVQNYIFPNNFSQIINETGDLFELESNEIGPIYRARGFIVNIDEPEIMITTKEYARYHNRMNPPGRAFNYFGVLPINKQPRVEIAKALILTTLKAEIRATSGQEITLCRFNLSKNSRIFNMYSYEEVPKDFSDFYKLMEMNILSFKGNYKTQNMKTRKYISEMFAKYFFNLINSEEIFKPVNSDKGEERANEYAPFQFLTSYLESLGYDGIKYKSTVNEKGANLVIFQPDNLIVINETLEHIKVE